MYVGPRSLLKLCLHKGRGLGPRLQLLLKLALPLTLIVFTLPFRRGGTFVDISSEVSYAVIFDLAGEDGLQVDDFLGKKCSLQLQVWSVLMKRVDDFRVLFHGCVITQESNGRGPCLIIKGAPQVPIQVRIIPSVIRGLPAGLQPWGRVLLCVFLDQEVLFGHLIPLPEVDGVLCSR